MYENDRRERRHGPDLLVKLITIMAVLGWVLMIVTVFFYGVSRPASISKQFWPLADKMDRIWNTEMLSLVLYFLVANFIIAIVGLLINSKRHKRKTDHYSLSLQLLTLMAAVGIFVVAMGYAG